jgi:hypothetical protein
LYALVTSYNAVREGDTVLVELDDRDGTELARRSGFATGRELFASDIEPSADGQLLIAGHFRDEAWLGGERFTSAVWSSFLTSVDADASVTWAHGYAGSGYARDLVVSGAGSVYFSGGDVSPPVDFGGGFVATDARSFVIRLGPRP